jgi:hypothetical protein
MRAHQRAHLPPSTHKFPRGELGRLGVTSV